MMLTEANARELLEFFREQLRKIGAQEMLDGIEESRRLGVEENLSAEDAKELRQVGAMRRRPLSSFEELHLVLQHLQERLVVLPLLATSTQERLKAEAIEWRVDTDFVSENRIPDLPIVKLLPEGHHSFGAIIANIVKEVEISSIGSAD